jgi:hypothetical protein
MTTTPSILIGGTIAIDHVKTPEAEAANLLGGSAAYAALAAAFFHDAVGLIGIIGHDFPAEHLAMLENKGVSLSGVERSDSESFTWSGEYHANMNERTTHLVVERSQHGCQVRKPRGAGRAEEHRVDHEQRYDVTQLVRRREGGMIGEAEVAAEPEDGTRHHGQRVPLPVSVSHPAPVLDAVFDRCDGALVLTGWNLSGG